MNLIELEARLKQLEQSKEQHIINANFAAGALEEIKSLVAKLKADIKPVASVNENGTYVVEEKIDAIS